MGRGKSLGQQLLELDNPAPEFDPEQEYQSGSESEDEQATEHYAQVGPSKMRPVQELYKGKRISRKDLASDSVESDESQMSEESQQSEDSQEEMDSEEELSGSNAFEGEMDSDNQPLDSDDQQLDSDDGQDDSDAEEQDDGQTDEQEDGESEGEDMLEELAQLEAQNREMVQNLSKSQKEDIEKGKQIQQQIKMWEGFLDIRIRFQKVLEAANKLPQHDVFNEFVDETTPALLDEAKEQLTGMINDLLAKRYKMLKQDKVPGDYGFLKRKNRDYDALYPDMEQLNEQFQPFRDETIEKWNAKVQLANGIPLQKKFKALNQGILDQIKNVLSDKERLIKRTQLKRADYKIIGKKEQKQSTEGEQLDRHLQDYDPEVFDDSDYYQQLLKELIESRMNDSEDPVQLQLKLQQMQQLQSKKNKKKVDTKASKGRKIRYQVHEKLQNFMTSEPRGTWHDEMIDELFANLFGQQLQEVPSIVADTNDGFTLLG
ncbi:apoptosis-antagonizing transcription factor [Gorgonomyces haynaldii]|nr:apoptosis-antagonizing transcription factor [Gorgonomyces haynaldii]